MADLSSKIIEGGLVLPVQETPYDPGLPVYLQQTYWWAYLHPRAVRFFDRQRVVNAILWGNFSPLRDAALAEIDPEVSRSVLQVACVYGNFTPRLAALLGPGGHLEVVDVAPIQLRNLERKLAGRANVSLSLQDASRLQAADGTYDQVQLFFLLHELPAPVRRKALREALRVTRPGGKVVLVDYHRPPVWHPHRYFMPLVFRLLEPFALDLWGQELSAWIPEGLAYARLQKSTYFGGLYQKVVITR